MALGLTQLLTEMSTRSISWRGKGGRCVGLTTLPSSCADSLEIWELQPPGTLRPCPPGLYRDYILHSVKHLHTLDIGCHFYKPYKVSLHPG